MNKKRNIGKEILAGIKEVKEWQQGQKTLKMTRIKQTGASSLNLQKGNEKSLPGELKIKK